MEGGGEREREKRREFSWTMRMDARKLYAIIRLHDRWRGKRTLDTVFALEEIKIFAHGALPLGVHSMHRESIYRWLPGQPDIRDSVTINIEFYSSISLFIFPIHSRLLI